MNTHYYLKMLRGIQKYLIKYTFKFYIGYIKKEEMENFYDKIKKKFNASKFKQFFQFFIKTRMDSKILKSLWKFSDILEKKRKS